MRNFLAALVFAIALVGGIIRALAGPPPAIWLKAPAFAGFEPAKIHVELHVTPTSADRSVGVRLESQEWGTSHQWEGDGVQVDRLYSFDFRDVPAGVYELTAVIGTKDAARAVDRKSIRVIERGH